jgi:thiol-disulfide isomerase/thioredoxin
MVVLGFRCCWHRLVAVVVIAAVFFGAACYAQLQPRADTHLSDYRGRWLLVNVWAGWCAPCMDEMPELEAFYQAHHDQVMVLGLNFDHLGEVDLKNFAAQRHVTFPLVSYLPLKELGVKEIAQVPMTFVVSPQGRVVKVLMGAQSRAQLLAAIQLQQTPKKTVVV